MASPEDHSMARDSGKPPLHPPETDGDTRVAPRPMPLAAPPEDDETRVGPTPLFATRPHQSDVETTIAPSPLAGTTPPPGNAAPQGEVETTIGPSPLAGALKFGAPDAPPDTETRMGSGLGAAERSATAGFQDEQTRVASIPAELLSEARFKPQPPTDEDDDATRVGSSPLLMSTSEARIPAPIEMPKIERRNIPSVDLPADLRLPTFEFKASDSPDVVAAKAAGAHADLPSHLQLPTFPDLGKPPVVKQEVSVPPPVRKKAPPPLPQVAVPAQPVLDLSLPEFAPRPTQRNLTLIGNAQQSKKVFSKRLIWPTAVALVCLSLAVGLFLARERVVAVLAPKRPPPMAPPPSPQDKARAELAAGGLAYVAKDYQVAIRRFEEALVDDPRLVEAHRSLGIVYATLHDQAKAVRHYQDYLALSPHAPDAADVLKIIEDYKHAQTKAAGQPAPAAAEPKHHKGAHGHRR